MSVRIAVITDNQIAFISGGKYEESGIQGFFWLP